MARVALTGGDYRARSVIAGLQECVNLFIEEIPQPEGESVQFVTYPTPGLASFTGTVDFTVTGQPVRGLYTASSGQVFAVIAGTVYLVELTAATTIGLVSIGTIENLTTPVRMQDNGLVLVIVDGIVDNGWFVTLNQYPATVQPISDPAWYGSTTVGYLDTFFLFNRPGTQQWYASPSNWDGNASGLDPFDGTYIASKSTYPDDLQALAVAGQVVYLIGLQTTELWYDAGNTDFPFGRVPGLLINHGTTAPYSVDVGCVTDPGNASVFWLSNDRAGKSLVFQATGYQAVRISTHAIEAIISEYAVVSDAIGYCYQQDGHFFYVLNFPTADATWCYDATTGAWHQRTFTESTGAQHMHRAACVVNALGFIVAGDNANGQLYQFTKDAYTDAGNAITRVRSFPHVVNNWQRVIHHRFTLDMQVGAPAADGQSGADAQVALTWSDDRGATFGQAVMLDIGSAGQTNLSPTVWRLGLARDRVYSVTWTAPVVTALIGAFIETETVAS